MPQCQDSQAALSQGSRSALLRLWLTFVLLLGLPAGVAVASHQYNLVFQPATAGPGQSGEAVIELMEPGTPVALHWMSCRGTLLAEGTVGPDGKLTLPFVVPENAPPGDVDIWVCDTETFEDEAWRFTVTAIDLETGPVLALTQDAGIPGSVVGLEGTGFGRGEWEVRLGDDLVRIGSALVGPDGILEGTGTIPLDTAEGATSVSACQFEADEGLECHGAPFEVTPPSLTIDPTEFYPSDTMRVSGAGWCCESETGTVVDSASLEWGTVVVDDEGALEGLVAVPSDVPSGDTLLEICVAQRCRQVPVTVLAVVVSTVKETVPSTAQSTIVETTITSEESGCAILPESLVVTPATGVAGTAVEIALTAATDSSPGCRFTGSMASQQVTEAFDLESGVGLVVAGVIPEGVATGTNTLEIVDIASQTVVAATVFEIEGGSLPWVVPAAVTVVVMALLGLLVRAGRRRLGDGRHSEEQEPPVSAPMSPRVTATINMPADIEAGRPFQLVVVLHPEPEHRLPELAIDVGLIGDGYEHDDTVRQRITTNGDSAFAVFPVIARPVEETGVHRVVAHISQGGHLVAWAQADPVIHPQGTVPTGTALAPATTMPLGTPDGSPPDLTLIITRGDDQRYLLWGFETPHPISLPTVQVRSDLEKENARAFAHDEVLALASTAPELVGMQLRGVATQIGGRVPAAAWQTLRDVAPYAASAGRPPVILIVSEETYVPWELAAVPDDLMFEPAAPALLGAQTVVGRWMPPDLADGLQVDHPRLPPSATIEVGSMAVVVHTVGDAAAPILPHAGEEAATLASTYGAFTVAAATGPVAGLLEMQHKVEGEVAVPSVLHLTCHGAVDPDHPSRSGVVLMAVEGSWVPLTPAMLRGSPLLPTAQPLVFINACATGTPQEALDGFGGLVGAALKSGARAVVAPLWKVDDRPARDVALAVYEETLGGSEVMGAAFRGVRAEATRSAGVERSFLAYVFFGHPMLRMLRASPPVTVADVAEMATG